MNSGHFHNLTSVADKTEERVARIVVQLKRALPTARPRIIELAANALVLHARKNNDYAGGEFASLGMLGKMADICRKVDRLHSLIIKGNRAMVKESRIDTAIDLAVFALLMAEALEKEEE